MKNNILVFLFIVFFTLGVVLFCNYLDKNCGPDAVIYSTPTPSEKNLPTNIYPSFVPAPTPSSTPENTTPSFSSFPTVSTTEPTTEPTIAPKPTPFLVLDDVEKHIFASLLRLEVGSSSYECQMAAASVVVNRMLYDNKGFKEVVYEKNQFSVAKWIDPDTGKCYKEPLEINWRAVEDICQNGPTLPYYVMYFRADYYHKWSTPYFEIDGTYFSYIEDEIYK